MKPTALDSQIHKLLSDRLKALEAHFNADILTYFGPFEVSSESSFLNIIEELILDLGKKSKIYIVLTIKSGFRIFVQTRKFI